MMATHFSYTAKKQGNCKCAADPCNAFTEKKMMEGKKNLEKNHSDEHVHKMEPANHAANSA